ncbi:hypothetical protein D3C71_2043070 [compost metagenome]
MTGRERPLLLYLGALRRACGIVGRGAGKRHLRPLHVGRRAGIDVHDHGVGHWSVFGSVLNFQRNRRAEIAQRADQVADVAVGGAQQA